MIGVDFIGRLGNQMFSYAFARMVAEQKGEKTFVANFKRCGSSDAPGWGDALCQFNVLPYTTEQDDLILKHGSYGQRLVYMLYMLCTKVPFLDNDNSLRSFLERKLRYWDLYFAGSADQYYTLKAFSDKTFIRGYFQDRRFFEPIRPILLKEFTPKAPLAKHNESLYQVISRPHTVCVSIRRGDYLSEAYKKDFYVCNSAYFEQAIASICQQVPNPVFIFFSDDIQWVRAHIRVEGFECYYERGDDSASEILRLMYSCHHFIISNSTFAWWAQYLGNREGKIVISPSRWFANSQWHSNLIDDSMQTI